MRVPNLHCRLSTRGTPYSRGICAVNDLLFTRMPTRYDPVSRNYWKHNLICYFVGVHRAKGRIRQDQNVWHDN
jgi:hypothetical protein